MLPYAFPDEALRASEEKYRTLVDSIDVGFCTVELLFDAGGKVFDWVFLETNPAFGRQLGIDHVVGKRFSEVLPPPEEFWTETYGRVCLSGRAERFEHLVAGVGRIYDVYAFRAGAPEQRRISVLFNDITSRIRAEQALREADRRKSDFLAMLGHELRNPLTAVEGGIKLLQSPRASPESRQAVLPIVAQQVAHMKRLIDDVLDLARIDRGKLQVKRVAVDLDEMLRASLLMTAGLAECKGSPIRYQPPEKPVTLPADRERLVQVFANLLSNAIKFSAPGSPVDLWIEPGEAETRIHVRDYGRGVAGEDLAEIFEPFVQSKLSLGLPEGGLGLGLSVSRELVELHGGKIVALSAGLNRGTTFVVSLPLEVAP